MPYKVIFSILFLIVSVFSVGGHYLWGKPADTRFLGGGSQGEVGATQSLDPVLSEHKQRFIQTLLPLIQHENNKILAVRANLLLMTRKASFVEFDRAVLARLSKEYRVPEDAMGERKLLDALLMRVDVLPADLVLAQAAMESAWGTSRFATEGNNYFGQWCFKKGCGLVPEKRKKKKRHEVRRFASPAESVRAYMRNINSHSAYAALRELRYRHKINKQAVSGEELAYGLESYSIMGESYVLAIRDIIQSNGLNRLAVAI